MHNENGKGNLVKQSQRHRSSLSPIRTAGRKADRLLKPRTKQRQMKALRRESSKILGAITEWL